MTNFEVRNLVETQRIKLQAMSENAILSSLPRVGITHGDINGTSYETILKAFGDSRMLGMMTPILYGQSKALSYYKKNFGMDDFNYSLTRDARQAWNQKFNILNIVDQELKIEPGVPTTVSAEMSALSLKRAVDDLNDGYIDALVTTPSSRVVEKSNVDFLLSFHKDTAPLRVMVSDMVRIGVATDDIPLADALAKIDAKHLAHRIATFSQALKTDFNITSPKIAVLGLDPYSSEPNPENKQVEAAITAVRDAGLFAFGPFPTIQLFAEGMWRKYDAVLALYQEQACLPIRMLSQGGSAYYWAGLPVLCVAPMQGPDFDIANTNEASPDALRAALYLALDVLRCRHETK